MSAKKIYIVIAVLLGAFTLVILTGSSAQAQGTKTYCADEGERCNFSGTKEIAYGAEGRFTTRTATNGINCNNSVFGDPNSGVVKSCYIVEESSFEFSNEPTYWRQGSSHGPHCNQQRGLSESGGFFLSHNQVVWAKSVLDGGGRVVTPAYLAGVLAVTQPEALFILAAVKLDGFLVLSNDDYDCGIILHYEPGIVPWYWSEPQATY